MDEEATEIRQQWADSDWHQVKRTQFECDTACYEQVVALMGDAGHWLHRPVWGDYEISAATAEGEVL